MSTLALALEQLDRHDALDDARELLLQDCEAVQQQGLGLESQTVRRRKNQSGVAGLKYIVQMRIGNDSSPMRERLRQLLHRQST